MIDICKKWWYNALCKPLYYVVYNTAAMLRLEKIKEERNMKNISKKLFGLAVFVAVIAFMAACDTGGGGGPGTGTGNGPGYGGVTVDFGHHENALIRVRNNTNQRLVAFRGRPDINHILGGIPANANNHGLSRSGFTTSFDFALHVITEAEFNRAMAAGGNQALQNAEIFNVIYAFHNAAGTNHNVFQISAQQGGAGRLILENPTPWNIEIRNNARDGITLGFVGPWTPNQVLSLEPADYILFPVMRRFNPLLGEIVDVQPVFPGGVLASTPYFWPINISAVPVTWNFLAMTQGASLNLVSGSAFVRVVNNSSAAIQFFNGLTAQATSMGSTFLNPGQTQTFQIQFPRNPDNSFSNTHTSNFGVGGPGVGRTGDVAPLTVNMDWLYEIQVTGPNVSTLTASALTPIQLLDIEGLFNN